jgi:chromosome segregation ATPase
MAVDERRRSELFERLAATIGSDQAATMFELLPPAGTEVATRADLDALEGRLERRFERIDARFDQLDARFDQTDARFDQLDARFDQTDARSTRVDDRFDQLERRMLEQHELLRHELTATFRGELVTAVAGQTRAVVTASVATALSVTAAVAALAQLL